MSAKHAMLGLLRDRPAYPYQLADRMKERLGPAWAINSGQLYQTISNLERAGLIERVKSLSERRVARQVFAITRQGEEELERWWSKHEMPEVRLSRRPLLVKLALAGPERLEEALRRIDAYELTCSQRLKAIEGERDEISLDGPILRADHVLLKLGLSGDIFQLEAELGWARHAREMVSWLLSREAIWPAKPGRDSDLPGVAGDVAEARSDRFEHPPPRRLRAATEADVA